MTDTLCTFIVPASSLAQAEAAVAQIPGGPGMFVCELSPTGEAPATHYVSSGFVRSAIRDALAPVCIVTEGQHRAQDAIAIAGLAIINEVQN